MGEATDDTLAEDFIAGRKDLQLEVSLGRRLIETYAAQIVRVRERIVVLHRQAEDGRAEDAMGKARQLVRMADALADAALGWMEDKVRPMVELHAAIMPPEDANQALVQGWGDCFYRGVRAEYEGVAARLAEIEAVRRGVHEMRAGIARLMIREVADAA